MNVLEKILEEIEERIKRLKEADNMCRVNAERNRNFESMKYFQSLMFATERAESIIGEIIRSHMDEVAEDWIPVEERLPEDGMYLCTLDGELCGIEEAFTGMCGIENGIWDEPDCVIAWQPLPEPYKPKKDIQTGTEHIMSRFMTVE